MSSQTIDYTDTNTKYRITAGLATYMAYSQKKNSIVMKMGYPLFYASTINLGAGFSKTVNNAIHHSDLEIAHFPVIKSDDGLGNNFLLRNKGSRFTTVIMEYQIQRQLFSLNFLKMYYAPLAGIDLQFRNLMYNSAQRERTADVNLFFGISSMPQIQLSRKISLQSGFDSFIYLPYFSIGKLEKWDFQGKNIEETYYRAFYYRTRFHGSVNYKLFDKNVRIGFRQENTVGFANSEPLFYIEELVHYRMERYNILFAEFSF